DEDGGRHVHRRAHQHDDHHDCEHQELGVVQEGLQQRDELCRDLCDGDQPGAHHGGGHEEHHHRRRLGGRCEDGVEVTPLQLTVDQGGHQQGVDRGHDGGLGGREHAELQAHQHDDGQHQRPGGLPEGHQPLGVGGLGRRCAALLARHQPPRERDGHTHHSHGHEPIGEIYVLGVDPEHQGKGIGKLLTLWGLNYLRRSGLDSAMLYVDSNNKNAIDLYTTLGFNFWGVDKLYTYNSYEI
ncbi:MAG: mycothiol synthase, partial [Actinomycetota bacterium]